MEIEKLKNLKKVLEDKKINDDFEIFFKDINSEKISLNSFRKIDENSKDFETFFIDGGNNIIFDETDLINFLVYVGFTKYKNIEFQYGHIFRFDITLELIESKEDKLLYKTHVDELDEIKIKQKLEKLDVEKIKNELIHSIPKTVECSDLDDNSKFSRIRKMLELKLSKILNEFSLVILDGSLDSNNDEEKKLIASIKNIIALSKKSKLITNSGIGFERFFNQVKFPTPWFVKIGKKDDFEIYALKFTNLKNYVFRLDSKIENVEEVLSFLYKHSKDGLAFGYPFGLVFIDHLARVSNEDAQYYRNLIEIQYELSEDLHDEFNSTY
ncbi:MAG: hypothetical protein QXR30_04855 [Candidatus Woesearchaeota archaeon]